MIMPKVKIVDAYANIKQLKFMNSRANRKTFEGGRGSGKTRTLGYIIGCIFNRFPRAKWLLAGLTYVQLDTIVLPEMVEALEAMNIYEYDKTTGFGHYVIGIKPPADWTKPYKPSRKYEYCISFINGLCVQMASIDRPDSLRGGNYDGLLLDESGTVKEEPVNVVLLPMLRANKFKWFADDPWHRGFFDFTSAAWTHEGMWVYKTEDLWLNMMQKRSLMTIKQKDKIPPKYLWLEATAQDNADALPDDYLEVLRNRLTPLQYQVEVENRRLGKLPNCFYNAFNSSKHCYSPSFRYDYTEEGVLIPQSNDYLPEKHLEISLDFNADFCCAIICQEVGNEFRVVNTLHSQPSLVDEISMVEKLANSFVDRYAKHEKKEFHTYGDPGGLSRSAGSNRNFYEKFVEILVRAGWYVYRKELTSYPSHKDKYLLLDMLLSEKSERLPKVRFNLIACKSLIIAIQQTPIKQGDTFEKDKGSEKRGKDQETATHMPDAVDYILWAKYKNLLLRKSEGVMILN
jgi:hypothetical protein